MYPKDVCTLGGTFFECLQGWKHKPLWQAHEETPMLQVEVQRVGQGAAAGAGPGFRPGPGPLFGGARSRSLCSVLNTGHIGS